MIGINCSDDKIQTCLDKKWHLFSSMYLNKRIYYNLKKRKCKQEINVFASCNI